MEWKSLLTDKNLVIAGITVILIIFILVLVIFIKRKILKNLLLRLIDNPHLMDDKLKNKLSRKFLLAKSSFIEKISKKYGLELLETTGINKLWLEELKIQKRKTNFNRILKYYPEKGLFTCFLISLEKSSFALRLLDWLNESDDFLIMRKIAQSGVGESFSGKDALTLFKDNLPQIREMIGDPEWASRYFAIKILLYDDNDQSLRAIWDSFRDAHPLVRKTIASEFITEDREKLYNELYRLFLNDPVLEVRAIAKERINKDFTDMYTIDIDSLSTPEALHALEHLSSFSKADEDTAIKFLSNDNLEIRFAAARFLEEQGALNRLIEQADLGDREDLERIEQLLKKSCEVQITSFLETVSKSTNTGAFYIAADILTETGDVALIDPICRKILALPQNCKENIDLYEKALNCINKRGTDSSLKHLKELLKKKKYNNEYAIKLLKAIPERGASFFISTLLELLCDTKFTARDELRNVIIRLPSDLYIQKMLQIIKSGRDLYAHVVRKDALKVLVELKQSFCLQTILENLPILPLEEAREFAKILIKYNEEEFDTLAALLFKSDDAAVRASLISCLPAIDKKGFLNDIKESLSDADPDVRISSIWALVDFKEKKTVNRAISMLRDPIERVRVEVAKAIAETGSDSALTELRSIIFDENEVNSVKRSAITGLGTSTSLLAIDILVDTITKDEIFDEESICALSTKTNKKEINYLIEKFKDGSPALRDKLTTVFIRMKEDGEAALMDLLREDIAALKPFICQVLENTGYIESMIRFLKHRDPAKRRTAASELSFIGTESAFRGIVLAARDSDEEVRISVTKALEKLSNTEGTEILKSLKEDPDKKVRKYTLWALERIKARNIEDEE